MSELTDVTDWLESLSSVIGMSREAPKRRLVSVLRVFLVSRLDTESFFEVFDPDVDGLRLFLGRR